MEHGPDVDPVTGRPHEAAAEQARMYEKQKADLKDKADFLPVAESEAAEALRDMVKERLIVRVTELIRADAAASAYSDVLDTLHDRTELARAAVERLSGAKR